MSLVSFTLESGVEGLEVVVGEGGDDRDNRERSDFVELGKVLVNLGGLERVSKLDNVFVELIRELLEGSLIGGSGLVVEEVGMGLLKVLILSVARLEDVSEVVVGLGIRGGSNLGESRGLDFLQVESGPIY